MRAPRELLCARRVAGIIVAYLGNSAKVSAPTALLKLPSKIAHRRAVRKKTRSGGAVVTTAESE